MAQSLRLGEQRLDKMCRWDVAHIVGVANGSDDFWLTRMSDHQLAKIDISRAQIPEHAAKLMQRE